MSGPQAIAKSPRTGDGPLWMGGCIGGSLNGGASAANAADKKKRGEKHQRQMRRAISICSLRLRLSFACQCAPERSKITFWRSLKSSCSRQPSAEAHGRSRHRPEPQKACQSVGTQDHHIAARRRANEKTPPRSLADFSNLLLVVGTSGACHHHVPCGLAQSMCRASFSASCR
jgi:hypothetical protein